MARPDVADKSSLLVMLRAATEHTVNDDSISRGHCGIDAGSTVVDITDEAQYGSELVRRLKLKIERLEAEARAVKQQAEQKK